MIKNDEVLSVDRECNFFELPDSKTIAGHRKTSRHVGTSNPIRPAYRTDPITAVPREKNHTTIPYKLEPRP